MLTQDGIRDGVTIFSMNNQHQQNSTKQNKKKLNFNYSMMSNQRIIQKPLVYVIGLSATLSFKDVSY